MWVARDEDRTLKCFYMKPVRDYNDVDIDEMQIPEDLRLLEEFKKEGGFWSCPASVYSYYSIKDLSHSFMYLSDCEYPELTWDDEPIEVNLYSRKDECRVIDDIVDYIKRFGLSDGKIREGVESDIYDSLFADVMER